MRSRAPHAQTDGHPDFILSLARGLKVIESFAGQVQGVTVGEVAACTGFSRAAARRFLITLEMLGYADNTGRGYRLTTRTLNLGFSYLSSTPLTVHAQPILDRIAGTVHESSSMAALDGDQIVYLARASAVRVMSIGLSIGSRLPAYCTSMGRVLLAGLSSGELADFLSRCEIEKLTPKTVTSRTLLKKRIVDARRDGFALVEEELEIGLRSIAVPVHSRTGIVIAAINIGTPALRTDRDALKKLLPILRQGADLLSRNLK